jgi:hypothetical protein
MRRTPDDRLAAAAAKLRIADLRVNDCHDGMVCLRATVAGHIAITRDAAVSNDYAKNRAALAMWLESRARNVLRGIETPNEAFADCAFAGLDVDVAPFLKVKVEPMPRSIEESIEVFRAALAALAIPERQVKVTWDASACWARFRAELPTGAVVDKTLRNQGTVEACLAALAGWLRGRAKNAAAGAEGEYDRMFAGAIVPRAVKR